MNVQLHLYLKYNSVVFILPGFFHLSTNKTIIKSKTFNEIIKIMNRTTKYIACLIEAMEIRNITIQNMENKLNSFQKE
jgi:hypothetical protein